MQVVSFLKENLPDDEFIHNKSVLNSFEEKRYFPDIRFELKDYDLIVEVDENKHRNYSCEEKRMHEITSALNKPCVFIRYNPDSKQSDKNFLLNKVKFYLEKEYDEIENLFDEHSGYYVEYLFY
jgi:hypothetical protein